MYLICSDSPIWDRDRKLFSTCFENMVLGFGPNLVTIFMIIVLGYKMRGYQESRVTRTHILMVFLLLVPIFGACASFFNISLLIKDSLHGHISKYHHWFISCSEFVLWMIVVLFIRCDYWSLIFCNPVFCFWWIMKVLLEVSHVFTIFSSSQAIRSFTEGFSISAEFMFVIFINLVRIMSLPIEIRNFDSLEEALLPNAEASEIHINKKKIGFLGYFHTLTFKVVNPMMDLGVTRQLNFQDLIEPPTELMPSSCFSIFLKFWEAEYGKNGQNASLIKVIFHAYGWPYLRVGLLKALNDVMNFIGPLILNRLIWFLQQGSGHFDGYTLAILLGLSSIVKSFLDTQYSFNLMKLKLKMRASIMAVIYRKCLQVSIAERSKFSDGEIQTFMSIDVDRTINLCNSFHDMWSLPLQIGLALFLLYTQVKFAFLSGLIITVLLIPVNKWICTLIGKASKKMMAQKDERIKSVGELLSHIRTVKMYSWEYFMANRIMEKRAKEVEHLGTRKYLDAWCVFFWATTPTLFSLFTFGVFTLMGHPLDAATVFTCVALFNTLISPLNSFPWVINGLIDAFISTGRLSKFLSCTEYTSQLKLHSTEYEHKTIPNVEMAIVFSEADCIWSSSEDIGHNIFLKKINLDLPKGFFIVVIGEIGSGKSSLLYSVLREMCQIQGYIDFHGSLAYVSQIPWIMSGTVRDNILFGKEYNARRYGDVLKACSLDDDISLMIGGDMAYIGEKGTNLSGGQRTRIALARALYCGSDVFLLDDILSAVDAHVGSWILHKAILGPLMRPKTCVLCTHSSQAISAADMVVLMDKGSVKWAGYLDNFIESPYSTIFMENDQNSTQALEQSLSNSACSSGEINHIISPDGEYIVVSEEAHENIEIEMRKEGKVELGAYKCYMKFCSWPIVTVICISAVLMQASRNGNDMWLSFWVDTTSGTKDSAEFYLVILCIFYVINSLLTLIRAFSFSYGGLRAAIEVHSNFLKNLINAPVHFFSQNPSGRILNRLSSDLYTIDDSLPFILNILLANFFNLLGIAIVLSYVQVLFVILLLPFWYIYQKIQ
ncbi:ABC transporter C family member 13, partial [Zostera marina]